MMKKGLIFAILAVILSCSSDNATIDGKFAGVKECNIIMEEMTPNSVIFVDSVRTNNNGEFSLNYKFKNESPVFLRIRKDNDFIILIAHPNEKIEVSSLLNLSSNYLISGSKDSELIKQLNTNMAKTFEKITELTKQYNSTEDSKLREEISYKIGDLYVKQKQSNIAFIVTNSKSMASIISLYQTFPNGVSIFGDNNDYQYFKLLSDSLSTVYPNNRYVLSIKKTINDIENREKINNIVSETILNNVTAGYPDINLPNRSEKSKKLSDLNGKVIMLVFWNPYEKGTIFLNKELENIYSNYSQKGFEIYQVTLDKNVVRWQQSMRELNLPWVNVIDPLGINSKLIRTYNIQSLPANYIISRDGDIVAKDLWGNSLTKKLNTLLK